ncbi:hypothetical protein T08_11529 [Trichinella sp. T8]|nr:hypothetical protein T08_11529 [Trichinella sp. T8]
MDVKAFPSRPSVPLLITNTQRRNSILSYGSDVFPCHARAKVTTTVKGEDEYNWEGKYQIEGRQVVFRVKLDRTVFGAVTFPSCSSGFTYHKSKKEWIVIVADFAESVEQRVELSSGTDVNVLVLVAVSAFPM